MGDDNADHPLTLHQAMVTGQLVINLPIFSGIALLVLAFDDHIWITLGGGIPWTYFWWSIVAPRWRMWAEHSGLESEELHKWGFRTGLVWPRGSVLEKTEIHLSDGTFFGLLGVLALLVFVTVETILSEFLETRIDLPGVFGSLVAAGISGLLVFPVQRSLHRLLDQVGTEVSLPPLHDLPC